MTYHDVYELEGRYLMIGMSRILVQKFGGTSVATPTDLRRVADIIGEARMSAASVVAVVSARGNSTDELLALATEFGSAPAPRELDQLLATGEVASAALLAIALRERGVPAVSLDARQSGITVRGPHGHGTVARVDTKRVCRFLNDGYVVVVAGFQGVNELGDVVTLGRGGSDTTAVALSIALGQDDCHIYTDVSGVYTTNPRAVPSARQIGKVDPAEIVELAFAGAKVVHPGAAGLAAANNVRLHVSSSFAPDQGTTICLRREEIRAESRVTAVVDDRDVAKISMCGASAELMSEVLFALAADSTAIDLFSWHHGHVIFTVRPADLPSVHAVLDATIAEETDDVIITENVAKASVIGCGLLSNAEYLYRTIQTLTALNIPVDTVSASQARISAVVPADKAQALIESLHGDFDLDSAIETSFPED